MAAAPRGLRRRAFAGPVYGLFVWLGFELGSPSLGLKHAKRPRPSWRAALAGDHVLYGLVLWRCASGRGSRPRREPGSRVEGTVQGVGFRPYVYRLAASWASRVMC